MFSITNCTIAPVGMSFGNLFMSNATSWPLLVNPVFSSSATTKPEYGSNRRIQVKLIDCEIAVTNVHVGSMGDIITYPIDVDPDLNISKVQLLDAILHELSSNGFSDSEKSDFWDDFDNLQKEKIVR